MAFFIAFFSTFVACLGIQCHCSGPLCLELARALVAKGMLVKNVKVLQGMQCHNAMCSLSQSSVNKDYYPTCWTIQDHPDLGSAKCCFMRVLNMTAGVPANGVSFSCCVTVSVSISSLFDATVLQ